MASYALIANAQEVKRAAVAEAAKRSGVDCVLVNRLRRAVTEVQDEPVQTFVTPDPADAFLDSPIVGTSMPVEMTSRVAFLMSKLFDAKTLLTQWTMIALASRWP